MNNISEIKVSYHNKVNLSTAPTIKSSKDAASLLFSNWDIGEIELRESFKILLLNRSNKVKGVFEVSQGGVSSTVVDAKLIFSVALRSVSTSIIIAHNHPSGNTKPSEADIQITKKLRSGAEHLDISILDHIIISPDGNYYSFADEGLL